MRAWFFIGTLMISAVAQAAELKDMRLWDSPDSTRVVFDLSASTTHKLFTLENPSRLVVDIAGVGKDGVKIATRQEATGFVQKVRSAPKADGSLRVVFDLSSTVTPKSFILEPTEDYGYRLVLDLQGPQKRASNSLSQNSSSISTPSPAVPASVAQVQATPPPVAAPTGSAPPAIKLHDKPIVIAIDAGHGGEDPGARGKSGLLEKNVSLSLARKLARMINATPGMKAVLTRDGDYYVGLRERVEAARKADADLFVSIHANAYKHREMRGTAVYVLSPRGATNEHARWLAHKENSADMVGGIEIQDKDHELAAVLIDLSQNATMEASFDVGSRILDSMKQVNTLQKRVVQQAGFVVLKAPDIPSVLVETAFISNDHEEKMLADPDYQEKMAHSILDGVRGYFHSYRPQQVADLDSGAQQVEVNYKPASSGGAQGAAH